MENSSINEFEEITKYSNFIDELFADEESGIEYLIEAIIKFHSENKFNDTFYAIQNELLIPNFQRENIENELNIIQEKVSSKSQKLRGLVKEIMAVFHYLEVYEMEEKKELLSEKIYEQKRMHEKFMHEKFKYNISNLIYVQELTLFSRINYLLKNERSDEKIGDYLNNLLESTEIAVNILAVHIQMIEVSKLMVKNEFFGSFFNLKICFDSEVNENLPIFKSTYAKSLFFELKKNILFGKSAQGLMALHAIFKYEGFFKTYLKDTTYLEWANQFYNFQRIMKPKELNMDKFYETYRLIKTRFDKSLYN